MVMPYHLHMPSYFLETFTEYPYINHNNSIVYCHSTLSKLFLRLLQLDVYPF